MDVCRQCVVVHPNSLLFSSERVRQAFLKMGHWFERSMGVVLILFAGRLVLSL